MIEAKVTGSKSRWKARDESREVFVAEVVRDLEVVDLFEGCCSVGSIGLLIIFDRPLSTSRSEVILAGADDFCRASSYRDLFAADASSWACSSRSSSSSINSAPLPNVAEPRTIPRPVIKLDILLCLAQSSVSPVPPVPCPLLPFVGLEAADPFDVDSASDVVQEEGN